MEYQRVAHDLRHGITEGRWQVGDKLPSEYELVKQYGVSRNTVRKALELLTATNLIRRAQGRGSFVAEQGVSHVLGGLQSFTETLVGLGKTPGIQNISVRVDPRPPQEAADFLSGSTTWLVQRVRTADGKPFCLMQSWLPDAIGAHIASDRLAESQSLYALMRANGAQPAEATEVIRAESAGVADARDLGVAEGFPLLSMYRWTTGSSGQALEYVRSAALGDRYQYVVKLFNEA